MPLRVLKSIENIVWSGLGGGREGVSGSMMTRDWKRSRVVWIWRVRFAGERRQRFPVSV